MVVWLKMDSNWACVHFRFRLRPKLTAHLRCHFRLRL